MLPYLSRGSPRSSGSTSKKGTMQEPYDITLTISPRHPPAPFRRHLWALVPALIVGSSLVLAACGSSESTATLNTEKIERAIARSSLAQRGQHAQVSCPSAVPQMEGLKFFCTAIVGSVSTRFAVVEQDGSGHVHYEAP
jgi:hypothetical protein